MGLFSSEKRTTVGTSVNRVIKDAALPDAARSGLTTALFSGDDIAGSVMEALIGSVGVRAERMYEYGRTLYTHGLPSGQFHSAVDGLAEVTAVLTALEGASAFVEYSHYRSPNLLHIGWLNLLAYYGYDPLTNELVARSTVEGHKVYLDNMTVVVPASKLAEYQAGALELWGPPVTAGYTPTRKFQDGTGKLRAHTAVVADSLATVPYIKVDCIWDKGPPLAINAPLYNQALQLEYSSFNIPVSGYDTKADYYHVKYTIGGNPKYWMYKGGSGTYPTLDAVFNRPPAINGTFFPFAYFRYNYLSQVANKTTDEYKTSKKLLKYLSMDYDQVADAINASPSITDVMQAMLVMAVPANTSDELERRYLFKFFDNLFYSSSNQLASPTWSAIASIQTGIPDLAKNTLVIQDKRFKMGLSNDGVYKQFIVANIGNIGSHTSSVEEILVDEEYSFGFIEGGTATRQIPIKVHVYKKQVSSTLCEEIRVVNLKMVYYVFDTYTVTADETDDTLLIPIDRSITSEYSTTDREIIYSRSLHYVFNSVQTITLEWYQQSWFSSLMTVVAVVVAIVRLGSATGPAAALMSAIAAGSSALITAAALALLQQLLIGMLIGYVLKLVAKAVGGDIAILLAVAAMAYGGYKAFSAGSISGAPWARELLEVSSGLSKAVSSNLSDMTKDLLAEYQSFNLFKDEQTKQLEAANKLLENDNRLNPFVIFGESPNDYYNRTVHSGNIGIAGISAISSYVDNALTLPKLEQSIGESTYG